MTSSEEHPHKKEHEGHEHPEGSEEQQGPRARGTAAMDPETRHEVARKGGLAVSKNKQHMAEIGRKGGQTVSKNREHMAQIGRKGGEASRRSKAAHSAGPGDQPSATAMGPAGAKPGLTTQPKPEKPSGEGSTGT